MLRKCFQLKGFLMIKNFYLYISKKCIIFAPLVHLHIENVIKKG